MCVVNYVSYYKYFYHIFCKSGIYSSEYGFLQMIVPLKWTSLCMNMSRLTYIITLFVQDSVYT